MRRTRSETVALRVYQETNISLTLRLHVVEVRLGLLWAALQVAAFGETFIAIQAKEVDCGPAFGSQAGDLLALKSEMLRPDLPAWIEQQREVLRLRVKGAEVAALLTIAAPASISQILRVGLASMFFSYDVVNFMREESPARRKQTKLAPRFCSLNHLAAQRCRNIGQAQRASARY